MTLDPAQAPPAPRGLIALALLASLLPLALTAWRWAQFPGWDLTDEAINMGMLQHTREGLPFSWYVTRGCFHRGAQLLFLRAAGWHWQAMWAAAIAFYALGLAALHAVGRRLAGPGPAWAAVLVGGAAALPAVQLGSLLSPQWQPMLWAGFGLAALTLRRPWQAALWGGACGALLLDYEGWALGLPGLAALLLLPQGEGQARVKAPWAGLGFGLGAGAALWHSAPIFQSYLAQRGAYSAPASSQHALRAAWEHLVGFFWGGGQALPTQGVAMGAAQFPFWALAPLLLALPLGLGWRRLGPRAPLAALLLAALAPLAAFAAHAPGVPSQRVLTAWPALCLLAGSMLAWAWRQHAMAAVIVAALVVAGAATEARAFIRAQAALGTRFYGQSSAWLDQAAALRQGPSPELLWELDAYDRGDLALSYGGPMAAPGQGPVWAVIPWQCAPALGAPDARWRLSEPGEGQAPCLLYQPDARQAEQLREAHRALKAFWDSHVDGPVYADLVAATQAPIPNPWLRDGLWEARFQMARRFGHPEPDEGERALALGLLRVDPLIRQARDLGLKDPQKSERLLRAALARDPRRREAWRFLGGLLAARKDEKALEEMNKTVSSLAIHSYEPAWLQE